MANTTTTEAVPGRAPDHLTNLQLLCRNCNLRKGRGEMPELLAKLLAEKGVMPGGEARRRLAASRANRKERLGG